MIRGESSFAETIKHLAEYYLLNSYKTALKRGEKNIIMKKESSAWQPQQFLSLEHLPDAEIAAHRQQTKQHLHPVEIW